MSFVGRCDFGTPFLLVNLMNESKTNPKGPDNYLSIVENVPDIITRWNRELKLVFANPAFESKTGAPNETLLDKDIQEIGRPAEIAQPWIESLRHVFRTGEATTHHNRFQTPEGETHFYSRMVPEKNGAGEVLTVLSITTDITALKIAERNLLHESEAKLEEELASTRQLHQLSEARLRTLADALPQLIWTNTAEGRADYFNRRWYEYSGLSYEQSQGLGWQAMVHPDDAQPSIEKWNKALATGQVFDTQYRLRRHDGSYCWFIGRNVPMLDASGNITGWFGTATDVDTLKKAEEALSESEARLRITMESATDYAIITMDTARKVERWSMGATQLFGYTEAEMTGQFTDMIFTDEDRKLGVPQQEMETARDTGRAADERWHQRKDGSRFYASGVLRPIQNGVLTGYVKIMRDMTQQQLFTEELHRLVAERTRELQRSNEDLRQFAHVASHDLKEPIRKIRTFNNRILDEYGDELPPRVKTYAEKVGTSADRMVSMIDGVLRYSKLGNKEELMEIVNLNEILEQVTNDLEVLIQQKDAVIMKAELPTLSGSPTLLYQLFYNLILNALKFSKPDEPSRIDIVSEPVNGEDNPSMQITLNDNGIGFEQEFAQDIFKTFTRLHPAEDYEGTGLGLALCKKIVERHGGSITATGEPDKGATFTIVLPLRKA